MNDPNKSSILDDVLTQTINKDYDIEFKPVTDQNNVFFDSYLSGEVDVTDMDKLKDSPFAQAALMAHYTKERLSSVKYEFKNNNSGQFKNLKERNKNYEERNASINNGQFNLYHADGLEIEGQVYREMNGCKSTPRKEQESPIFKSNSQDIIGYMYEFQYDCQNIRIYTGAEYKGLGIFTKGTNGVIQKIEIINK